MIHLKSLVILAVLHASVPVLHVAEVELDLAADPVEVDLAVAAVARPTNLPAGGAESPGVVLTHRSADDRTLEPK